MNRARGSSQAVGLALWLAVAPAAAEELTLTTYYPTPRTAYRQLRVTNNASLALTAGAVLIGTRAKPASGVPFVVPGAAVAAFGTCPAGTAHYNEDAIGIAPDPGECRPTALATDAQGRVSLGTALPSRPFRLHVLGWASAGTQEGTIALEPTAAGRSVDLSFLRDGDGRPAAHLALAGQPGQYAQGSQPGDLILRVNDNHDLHLAMNPTIARPHEAPAHLTLKNAGHIGLGTTSPAATLDVRGLLRIGGFSTDQEADATVPPGATVQDGSSYYNTTSHQFLGRQNGAWKPLAEGGLLYSQANRVALFAGRRTNDFSEWVLDPVANDWVSVCRYLQINGDATAVVKRECGTAAPQWTFPLIVGCAPRPVYGVCHEAGLCIDPYSSVSDPLHAAYCADWYGLGELVRSFFLDDDGFTDEVASIWRWQ